MAKVKIIKRKLILSGMMTAGATWGVTLYWTLVSNGYLSSPWVV